MSAEQRKNTIIASLTLALGMAALPQIAQAMDRGTQTFRVNAHVPVSCWVKPDRDIVAGEGRTGQVIEACNNPGGYTVTAHYRPLADGERAQMVYNERAIDLSADGDQLLRRSSMATIKTVNYRFRDVALSQPLTVFLTIQPL